MKKTGLDAIAAQVKAAQEGHTSTTSLVVGRDGVISERTRDDEGRRDLSSLTGETFAASGCSTCGGSRTCRNCDGKGYFSAPWAVSCRHCGGSGRCPNN